MIVCIRVRLLEVRVHVVRVKQRYVKRSPDDIGTAEQRDNDDQVLETRARRARESTAISHPFAGLSDTLRPPRVRYAYSARRVERETYRPAVGRCGA